MKTTLAVLGQFVLFCLFLGLFAAGILLASFHLSPIHAQWFISHPTPTSTRAFDPTGLVLMTAFFLIVFSIEAAARRLRTAGLWTTVVFILALVLGFAAKFGFSTHDLY